MRVEEGSGHKSEIPKLEEVTKVWPVSRLPPGGWPWALLPAWPASPLSRPVLRSRLFWVTAGGRDFADFVALLSWSSCPHRWVRSPSSIGWWGGSEGWRLRLVAALAGGGRESHWLFLPGTLPAPSRLPWAFKYLCLILAFLFSGLGFAGFSAMAKPVLPESSFWKLPCGWGWAPGEG